MSIGTDELTEDKPLQLRWVMIGFAFFATVLNYIHRLSFTYLSADGDLRKLIPDDAFGYLATAFLVAYALSNAFSGLMIDRLGTRIGYSLCMAFWTTAGLFHAFAITPLQFGVCRFLLGMGEAGNWPAALRLTSEWFPPKERSTAAGIFNSGSALGAIIVPPLVAAMAIHFSWQYIFILLALLGYLWLVVFWFFYYTPDKPSGEARTKAVPAFKLLKSKFVSRLFMAKIFIEPVWYFTTFWIGRYLADVHHWDLNTIGKFAWIPFVMADAGNIIGGYFTQFIIKNGMAIHRARRTALILAGIFMAVPLFIAPLVVTTPMVGLLVFGLSSFGYTAYTANALALTADVVPKNSAASAWGLACVGNGIGGGIIASVSGLTLKTFSQSLGYVAAYNILFLGFGVLVVVGMLILIFLAGSFEKDHELEKSVLT